MFFDWRPGAVRRVGADAGGERRVAHGIAYGTRLWVYEQPTPYYRRHLLLHEGTHAFMAKFLGSCGPGWYMEGTAELLATHRIGNQDGPQTGELEMRIMPRDRREVPMLGRVKLVRDAVAEGRVLSLDEVMKLDNRRQMDNESYAWCWAAAKWLDSHPRYRDRFRQLYKHVQDADFNQRMRDAYVGDWSDLVTEWQAYVATLDHGYDFERMAIEFKQGKPLSRGSTELAEVKRQLVTLAADRGWQSSGVWLEAGQHYRVTAAGRYEIARETVDGRERMWQSEPGGVTIEYRDGFPLGMLLGAIDARTTPAPDASSIQGVDKPRALTSASSVEPKRPRRSAGFAQPFAIGLRLTITPDASGTLYLRVNDSGGKLGDNRGNLSVTIEAVDAVGEDCASDCSSGMRPIVGPVDTVS